QAAQPEAHRGQEEERREERHHDRAAPQPLEDHRVVLDDANCSDHQSTRLLPVRRRKTSSRVPRRTSELSGRSPRRCTAAAASSPSAVYSRTRSGSTSIRSAMPSSRPSAFGASSAANRSSRTSLVEYWAMSSRG